MNASDDDETVPTAPTAARMRRRRATFAVLVAATTMLLSGMMVRLLAADGLSLLDAAMTLLFVLSIPWLAIGFWNAVIGFAILHGARDPLALVLPLMPAPSRDDIGPLRTAIAVPIRNEDPRPVFDRIAGMLRSLDATGGSDQFEVYVLSDTSRAAIGGEEERLFAGLRAADVRPERLHYRRRDRNDGFKAGNIRDFVDGDGHRFDAMIVLDADSLMSGRAMRRLAQLMRSNPRLGILQTLVVGLPADRPFARIFQFGMRNGMRPYTVGSAWWQGDCGPYWGHNAIIRLAPFRQHCRLPRLPGEPPLGGDILSHDQVEAVLMRRAGYEVRVLPEEDGSFEENPPTLPDFMQRDLRWCQGNMQYLHHQLIGMPGLHLLGRVQLLLAILMYAAAPAWLGLLALGLFALCLPASLPADGAPAALPPAPGGVSLGLILFAATLLLSYIQKWLSVLDVLLRPQARRSAGGWGRILVATAIEAVFSVLLSPVLAVAQTMFIGGLAFGRTIRWSAQSRQGRTVPLLEALRGLWPQTVAGSLVFAVLALRAPELLPWAAPVIAGLVLAVPFASVTASARLGGLMKRYRICATPEELAVGEAAEPVAAAAASFLSAQERVVAAAETEGGRT